jgi:hypothetical protein
MEKENGRSGGKEDLIAGYFVIQYIRIIAGADKLMQ